jgi:Uma2 family endonuclease
MSGNPVKTGATYEDLCALPENFVGEIIAGELYASPRPAPRHALATSVLGGELMAPFHLGRGGPGGWWLLVEPELHCGDDVLVPDLAGWRREGLPSLPRTAFFTVAPDWICEVLSPATRKIDRAKKLPIYARECVRHAWLVDPVVETLEVLRLELGRWREVGAHEGSAAVRAEPFDAIALDLRALWLPDEP